MAEAPGIGVHTATALVATLGDGRSFRHGQEVAAVIGLAPRQASIGGKDRLLGISKRGDGPDQQNGPHRLGAAGA